MNKNNSRDLSIKHVFLKNLAPMMNKYEGEEERRDSIWAGLPSGVKGAKPIYICS